MASYVEFSLIEKLHARITEVSPANPGETLNDAVERLIAERNIAREIAEGLRLVLLEESNGLVMAQLQREAAIAERDALREEVERLHTQVDALCGLVVQHAREQNLDSIWLETKAKAICQ